MFKKKKNDDNQSAPEKAAPKAKAKKSKSSGGGGGLKAFFLHHVEKIVLCGIAGLAGFLVYNGTTVKSLPGDKTPQQLTQISTTAESAIRQDHWSAIEAERKFDSNFSSVVERSSRPNDVSPYPAVVWDPKPDRGGQKRQDPKLLPPIDLEVQTVVASLASSTSNKRWVDPLKDYKNAPSYMKKGASLGGSGSGALGEEGSGSGYGMEGGGSGKGMGMGSGGQGGNDVIRNLTGKYDRGFGGASRSSGSSMGSEGGSLGDYGDAGMGSGSGSGSGMGMGMGMGMGSGGMGMKGSGGSGTNPSAEVIPMPSAVMFNAITGLVPYEDQIKEYDLALANSANHDPRRDAPNYKGFTVQRVAITNGDPNREIKDDEWETLDEKKLRITPTQRDRWWQGVCPEIVHSYYTHPMLTMSIPPVLIHDYRGFAKHSKAPSIYDQVLLPGQKRVVDTENDGDFIKTGDGAGGAGKGMGMGAEGSGMGYGSEAGGMGLGMEGYGQMGSGGGELGSYGSEESGSGMGGMGGMGSGMGMGVGMPTIKSKYKVIRFYDFDVKPGVVYRYRVSVHVDDPNYSAFPNSPAMPTLEQEALKRVQVLEAADKKANEKILAEDYENGRPKNMIDPRTGKKKLARKLTKTSERKSDWSIASRAVRAPMPGSIAVGKLASESRPYMQVATAEWKVVDGVGVDLYRLDLVTAGFVVAGKFSQSIGGTKAGPTLIHPLSRKVVLAPNELNEFRPRMALEVRMPEKLSLSSTKDPMETAAELVMVDMESGDVKISNEFADFDNFRMYSFADEQETATKANRNAPPGGSGSGSGGGKGGGKNMGGGSSMSG